MHAFKSMFDFCTYTVADPGILEPGARYIFFRSGDCCDAPLYIPFAFVVRAENKIHIVNIVNIEC